MKDPEKRLALIWEDLENTYGHGEQDSRTELDAIHRWLPVECTEHGLQSLLKHLEHGQIHVSWSLFEHELEGSGFIEGMISRLLYVVQRSFRDKGLFRPNRWTSYKELTQYVRGCIVFNEKVQRKTQTKRQNT